MNGTCCLQGGIVCLLRIGIFHIKNSAFTHSVFICSLEVSQQRPFAFLCNIPIKEALTTDERIPAISHLG